MVENAEITVNNPRRSMAGRSENSPLALREAANTHVMTASHRNMVRISRSLKNTSKCPFHTSECKTKLMEPSSMSSMSTSSMENEW